MPEFTSWAIFLTRVMPPARVGLGMAIAAGLGLLAATPCGQLADRLVQIVLDRYDEAT